MSCTYMVGNVSSLLSLCEIVAVSHGEDLRKSVRVDLERRLDLDESLLIDEIRVECVDERRVGSGAVGEEEEVGCGGRVRFYCGVSEG